MASGNNVSRNLLEAIKHKIDEYKNEAEYYNFSAVHYGMNMGNYCCYYCNGLIFDMNYHWLQVDSLEQEYLVCGKHCTQLPDELKLNCVMCGDVADIGDYGHYAKTMTWKCQGCMFKK